MRPDILHSYRLPGDVCAGSYVPWERLGHLGWGFASVGPAVWWREACVHTPCPQLVECRVSPEGVVPPRFMEALMNLGPSGFPRTYSS